jgi:hypothetical protein
MQQPSLTLQIPKKPQLPFHPHMLVLPSLVWTLTLRKTNKNTGNIETSKLMKVVILMMKN